MTSSAPTPQTPDALPTTAPSPVAHPLTEPASDAPTASSNPPEPSWREAPPTPDFPDDASTPHTPEEADAPAEQETPEDHGSSQDADLHDEITEPGWAGQVSQRIGTNRGTVIGTLIEQGFRRLRGIPLPPAEVAAQLKTYVRHEDDDQAIHKILDQRPVVVLTGQDGTGRFSTALDVLRRRVGDTIRQVRREPDAPFDMAGLQEPHTGWILDLRAEQPPAGFGRELVEDADKLPEGSCLVVLMSTTAWATCGRGAAEIARPLEGPPRKDILGRQLKQAPFAIDINDWLSSEPISGGIASLLPAQVAAWANAIITTEDIERRKGRPASDGSPDTDYFKALVREVVKAAEDWRTELLNWHNTHSDSAYRNYLLAAAVLEGASSDKIYKASGSLATALNEKSEPRSGQQGLGVVALTHTANADLQPDGTIRFRYHNYAEAVVDYFLDDRPHLLEEFTRWTAAQVTTLGEADLTAPLAQRVSHWTVHYTARHRRTSLLRSLAEQWSSSHADAACDLLVLAAIDDHAGALARNAYRRWANETDTLSTDFKVVLIRAVQRLAAIYPTSMLSRIAELATPAQQNAVHSDKVTAAISQALNALWDQDDQRSAIHKQLTQWAADHRKAQQAAAQSTFAHLATRGTPNGPALLTDKRTTTPWLADMWRNALPTTTWSPVVAQAFAYWMQTALDTPDLSPTIQQIFLNAVHRPTDPHYSAPRLLAMQNLLFSWAPAPPSQVPSDATHLRDQLLTRLRAEDPAAPPDPHAPQP
ncbi:hypothetical protein [Streptomyces coeruleorubidus]|uniref:Uncharacterized protein n=1 Tax=Streptomyces coeruleorubidus TaxID=116188 RepID=A0A5J6IDM4_STRC4|nr:hypothetical protein [Streptomyces coeruleorubidus]QEV28980.1 hypothetical protein CP976_35935 [Streptomyces coeruleorubidus]GGT71816.1 hypothetical protein GCM10010256_32710 [Streptomyces coeruleorubidus]